MHSKFIKFFYFTSLLIITCKYAYSSDTEESESVEPNYRTSHISQRLYGGLRPVSGELDKSFFHSVLSLECEYEGGRGKGTALLISENFALIAAHVVFDKKKGEAKKITCHFASIPENTFLATSFAYPCSYTEISLRLSRYDEEKKQINISIMKEKGESSVDNDNDELRQKLQMMKIKFDYALTYFKENNFDSFMLPLFSRELAKVAFAGYPAGNNKQNKHIKYDVLNEGEASLITIKDDVLIYQSKAIGGMSGGPIVVVPEQIHINYPIAIISASDDRQFTRISVACLITSDKLDLIEKWKQILMGDVFSKSDGEGNFIRLTETLRQTVVRNVTGFTLSNIFKRNS